MKMIQFVIFINLFVAPLLPLYVVYRKRGKRLEPNLDLLFQYGIVAVCNIPLTKIFICLIRKIAGIFISIDSGYYTVAALLPTIITILAYAFYKTYPDHEPLKEKIIQKGIKGVIKDLAPACVLMFIGCFMLFIFEPLLMYATNTLDFWFDFYMMIGPVLRVFAIFFIEGIVFLFAVYLVDLMVSKRLFFYKGIMLIGSIVFFLTYLQGNWLAGNLPVLNGENILWENYGKLENFILMSALIILVIMIIVSIRKHGINRTVFYTTACTSVVFVMLFSSLVPTLVNNNAFAPKKTFSPTWENFSTISTNSNFLIFLLDASNSKVLYDTMMEDEDFRGMLDDFTYYPDTASVFPQTTDSIQHILSGQPWHCETEFQEFSSNAYNQSPLFEKLSQNGYEINLYSQAIRWNGGRNYDIQNARSIYDYTIDFNSFKEHELKYILFKYLPYELKQFSDIETLNFDKCKKLESEYGGYWFGVTEVHSEIVSNPFLEKQGKNYFQFVHTDGAHPNFDRDKDLNLIKDGTYEQKMAAALTVTKAYLQRLKDNGTYDNSIIVILADHGYHDYDTYNDPNRLNSEIVTQRFNPALFIKGINERHEMLVSDRCVSYADLEDAFCDLIDGKQSTELFVGLDPSRTRTLLWSSSGKLSYKVEFTFTGTIQHPKQLTATGNIYKVHDRDYG